MTNARISDRARAILRNKPLARAIADAIVHGCYTPELDGIIVQYKDKEFIIRTATYRPIEQDFKKNKK